MGGLMEGFIFSSPSPEQCTQSKEMDVGVPFLLSRLVLDHMLGIKPRCFQEVARLLGQGNKGDLLAIVRSILWITSYDADKYLGSACTSCWDHM